MCVCICVPTDHPRQDHPLHGGGWGPLAVGVVGDDVLRGEDEEEEEGEVGRGVADELDEGLADEQAVAALGRQHVQDGEEREEEADQDAGGRLDRPVAPAPARQLVVPARR